MTSTPLRHVLETSQFITGDAARVAGVSEKSVALLIAPERAAIRLHSRHANPGTGRRRMFNGFDVLAIATAFAASAIGFPQRFAAPLADAVVTRAKFRLAGLAVVEDFEILAWPIHGADDWARGERWRGGPEPELPEAYHTLRVDHLIDRVTTQLEAIADEKPFPELVTPIPDVDIRRAVPGMWARDAEGRAVLAGLTHDETKELSELIANAPTPDAVKRFWELDAKHRRALEEGDGP
jgi:hypothetical protein